MTFHYLKPLSTECLFLNRNVLYFCGIIFSYDKETITRSQGTKANRRTGPTPSSPNAKASRCYLQTKRYNTRLCGLSQSPNNTSRNFYKMKKLFLPSNETSMLSKLAAKWFVMLFVGLVSDGPRELSHDSFVWVVNVTRYFTGCSFFILKCFPF